MERRSFGPLGAVSALSLGGGGIAGNWGTTDRDEAVATVREALENGITLIDVAPTYGDGEGERVVGDALQGRVPDGVQIATKYGLPGNPPAERIPGEIERVLSESLSRMRIERVDLLVLHTQICPDQALDQCPGASLRVFRDVIRPTFARLVAEGRIGAWGITAIGVPSAVLSVLSETPGRRPRSASPISWTRRAN